MNQSSLVKAGIFALLLVTTTLISWELHLRNQGISISYDDDEGLWADKREKIYLPADKATVLIGSSRNKYDIDIPTWEKLTGDEVIQLSCVGSSPLPTLDNLANDKNFKGKLIVDVTEILFFSTSPHNSEAPVKRIEWYNKRTPAQWFSFKVNTFLESNLVFLDKDYYSLNALINRNKIPNRKGVFQEPDFPMDFERVTFERQCFMTDKFVEDTNQHNQVKAIWEFFRSISKDPPMSGHPLDSLLNTVKTDVDKIKARGGQVLFIRTPSSGGFLMGERMGYPREKYWERVLSVTNCPGIHFEDYPAIAHFECPELSHLKPSDAIIYTTTLVDILQKEKGWIFPHKPTAQ
ncbi:hypothetical protein LK994_08495 [Ferruginibacter lapsinanis]|uniref:hypothetical protein n=1 Tax=Ferruginibacter lapsinanis TaxID=563172 RepID=UPI001E2F1F86|nr:hypothetical protein [Ferruginibacter lapsinanis]UEG48674.1 hypothetical protein LK994_08495 [Ferruginibacter lapsinanis]